jgi:hypothetical protein
VRAGVFALVIFFIAGLTILLRVNVRAGMRDASESHRLARVETVTASL